MSEKNKLIIEEWQAELDRLFTELELWLGDADAEGIIECERSICRVRKAFAAKKPVEIKCLTIGSERLTHPTVTYP